MLLFVMYINCLQTFTLNSRIPGIFSFCYWYFVGRKWYENRSSSPYIFYIYLLLNLSTSKDSCGWMVTDTDYGPEDWRWKNLFFLKGPGIQRSSFIAICYNICRYIYWVANNVSFTKLKLIFISLSHWISGEHVFGVKLLLLLGSWASNEHFRMLPKTDSREFLNVLVDYFVLAILVDRIGS